MCTGRLNNDFGVFMFGGYGHHSDYNMADLWFLKVNISTVFDNPLLNNFYSPENKNSHELYANYFSTIHLHAILMFVGWGVFLNIGILIASYGKSKDKSRHDLVVRLYRFFQVIYLAIISVFFELTN